SFIIKILRSKTPSFRALRTLFIGRCPLAPLVEFSRPSPDGYLLRLEADSPERFRHLPRDPECDGCARSSSQGANPIFKPLRFHRHQLRITRPVSQDRYSLQ